MNAWHDDITDVPGISVGHDTNLEAGTGCTVVLCETPMVGGIDVRGGAPATRETDLLHPLCLIEEVHAILLTGGSSFGLDAATGVVRYLVEQNRGFDTGVARVPIVPGAAIFDLAVGSPDIRPDAEAGYRASQQAGHGPIEQGNAGAGTGATVGKLFGPTFAMKGGLGSASLELAGGAIVGALAIVNPLGEVIEPQTGHVIAGTRHPQSDTPPAINPFGNTTIAVIATNVPLSKAEVNKLSQMAHDGIAHAIRPAHTMFDGDAIFALAPGNRTETHADSATAAQRLNILGNAATITLARAIVKGVRYAQNLHGYLAVQ